MHALSAGGAGDDDEDARVEGAERVRVRLLQRSEGRRGVSCGMRGG